jgi:transposase
MEAIFESYEPDQIHLLPPSPRDWLGEGHLAHFISDTVDQLDLSPFFVKYAERASGKGQKAYHPAMMLKILIYSYCVGIFSSRKIMAALQELVPLRFLAAGNYPGHRTIARFREQNLAHFQSAFLEVVRIAQEAGLVAMGTLAVDGSRVKANASKHKAMSYKRMIEAEKKLKKEIRKITRMAKQIDEAEDAEFGPDFRGDELPEELKRRKDRLQKIQEAKRRLEVRQQEEDRRTGRGEKGRKLKRPKGVPPGDKQDNFTDPDSRIMNTGGKSFEQCYNAQSAVDEANRIIVAVDVGTCAADAGELLPMVDAAERNTGAKAKRVLADSGYKSEENLRGLEERGTDGYIALGKGERVPDDVDPSRPATRRMARKLRTKAGRKRYKKRKGIVEPAFGWIKNVLGFRSFSMRGLPKAAGEWNLVCLAINLRRMHGMIAWK